MHVSVKCTCNWQNFIADLLEKFVHCIKNYYSIFSTYFGRGNRSLLACTTIFDTCPILLQSEMSLLNILFIISCINTLCINNILCNNNNKFIK